jgi:hypothetical protein
MYNVEVIYMELLMEEVGVALMEPQMENIRQLQKDINN